MLARAGEPELVGLAVHGQQPFGQVAEHGDGHGRAAHVGPGAPGGADLAAQH